MIRTLPIASAVLLGACATVQAVPALRAASPSAATGLSAQDVAAGFAIAVVDGCVAAAEAGKTLAELGNDKIVPDASRDTMRQPQAGSTAWAPRTGQGIVAIDESTASCDVSAYGPPVGSTLSSIVSALLAKGFESQSMPPSQPKYFQNDLRKTVDGRTVKVVLIGNEPGAAGMLSRFSGLSAFVTRTTP